MWCVRSRCSMFILLLSVTSRSFVAMKYSPITALGICPRWVLSLYWGQFSVFALKTSWIIASTDRKPKIQIERRNCCSNMFLNWTVRLMLLNSLIPQNWGISWKLFIDHMGSPCKVLSWEDLGMVWQSANWADWQHSSHAPCSQQCRLLRSSIQGWSQPMFNTQVEVWFQGTRILRHCTV